MKVLLGDWLESQFSPAPAIRTARTWIKQGRIFPPPTKVGRSYYVEQDAVFNDGTARPRLADRIPQ
ncbi:excisionase [Paraburkholderia acidisoli]|uniref:Excisionase n=1 Tax=Paraburkholderia acidisoli TaxID=2571748 RepID=A0A7Z2GR32_9BURK|nr:excisionase [Paraburkholderia acidisoli]QGZ66330.1 excisionase [Paraburkholderia acidisoli]QGZ66413.1 excisionase [Paraburkholderia acidisoli]